MNPTAYSSSRAGLFATKETALQMRGDQLKYSESLKCPRNYGRSRLIGDSHEDGRGGGPNLFHVTCVHCHRLFPQLLAQPGHGSWKAFLPVSRFQFQWVKMLLGNSEGHKP
jgi:hypothetical protein